MMSVLDEPVRGGYADLSALGFSGRERLTMFGSELPFPPYVHLLGLRLTEVGDGTTKIAMPASRWLLSPQGRVTLGMVANLADVSFGSALETRLPGGQVYTTAEMSLQRLGTAAVGTTLEATGELVHLGADVALTATRIVDGKGRLIAYGTSRLTMFPPMEEYRTPPAERPTYTPPVFDTPDPWQREPTLEPLDHSVYEEMTGREIIEAQVAGKIPQAPLSELIGMTIDAIDDEGVEVVMPAHPWLTNHMMSIHGGFIAALADSAMQLAVQATAKAADRFAPLDFKVNFLRPVSPDGGQLRARGKVVYRGRTNAVAVAEVVNDKGKTVAMSTGAAMFNPSELIE